MTRKPIAIALAINLEGEAVCHVVCNDGTIWTNQSGPWQILNAIPQPEPAFKEAEI